MSQPGRAGGALLADDPDGGGESGGAHGSQTHLSLCLDRPGAVDDEAGPDKGCDKGLPSSRTLARKDNNKPPLRLERFPTRPEGLGHTVFVVLLGKSLVSIKATRIVDQFSIIGFGIPFRP